MTNEEFVIASQQVYMIPKKFFSRSQPDWLSRIPDLIPCILLRYIRDRDEVEFYGTGAFINSEGGLRDGFCQGGYVPAGELGQYQVGSNNKHKRLETYIQRRQR